MQPLPFLLLFPINSFDLIARKEQERRQSFSPPSLLSIPPKKRIPIIENRPHEAPPLIIQPCSSCLRFRVSIRPESPSRFPSSLFQVAATKISINPRAPGLSRKTRTPAAIRSGHRRERVGEGWVDWDAAGCGRALD